MSYPGNRTTPKDVIHTVTAHLIDDVVPIVFDLDASNGQMLVDAVTGRKFLDCASFFASNPVGYNHPLMHDPVFEKKLLRAARVKPANSDFLSVELADFVNTFSRVMLPSELSHLFFVEGGALAVENAIKAAVDWKVQKNFEKGLKEEKGKAILHFSQAFHGRSGYTLSLTNTADPRKIKFFPKFCWPRVINPCLRFPVDKKEILRVCELEERAQREMDEAFLAYSDDIAAIIIEPIQGEGGDNFFRPEFHKILREYADNHEALLIYDEVQSGMGLTGKNWAFQHYGVVPDIVAFGKKAQVCGIMAGKRLEEVSNHVFKEPSRINSTWGGSLVDMVRSEQYLKIIEEENLVNNAAETGTKLLEGLVAFTNENTMFSNARGLGLMCAFDCESTELRNQMLTALRDKEGVLLLGCGVKSIRFRPSLNFSDALLPDIFSALNRAVKHVMKKK